MLLFTCFLLASALPSTHPRSGSPEPQQYQDCFGRCVAALADLDGDGVPEIGVGAPWQQTQSLQTRSAVHVFSGADGAPLITAWCGPPNACDDFDTLPDMNGDGVPELIVAGGGLQIFSGLDGSQLSSHWWKEVLEKGPGGGPRRPPHQVEVLQDLDGDGFPEVAVSNLAAGGLERGSVRVYSPRTWKLIHESFGEAGEWLGASLGQLDDLDGDGVRELLVGGTRGNRPDFLATSNRGVLRILSGATGYRLRSVEGALPGDGFGHAVLGLPDVTGDGVADFAVGAPDNNPGWQHSAGGHGYVRIFSGADGGRIHQLQSDRDGRYEREPQERKVDPNGPSYLDMFGFSLAGGLDANGDGVADLVVGAAHYGLSCGSVGVYCGRSGKHIHDLIGEGWEDRGRSVFMVEDLNGDGVPDFGCSAVNDTQGAGPIGRVQLFSGATGELLRTLRSPLAPPEAKGDEK